MTGSAWNAFFVATDVPAADRIGGSWVSTCAVMSAYVWDLGFGWSLSNDLSVSAIW